MSLKFTDLAKRMSFFVQRMTFMILSIWFRGKKDYVGGKKDYVGADASKHHLINYHLRNSSKVNFAPVSWNCVLRKLAKKPMEK